MLAGAANGLEHRTPGPKSLRSAAPFGNRGTNSSPAIDDRGGGAKGMSMARRRPGAMSQRSFARPSLLC
ncbi:hypothetical protein F8B43_5119 [Methylorubrum populi]|uniref:Uncharacterized protein n=1 Tax=Methylorubrum populi TaxID=223967 RepID=A0A833J1G0_9HYPH|nr:hypothetical protein F8B43_5119 [Methylorubrum populi]